VFEDMVFHLYFHMNFYLLFNFFMLTNQNDKNEVRKDIERNHYLKLN